MFGPIQRNAARRGRRVLLFATAAVAAFTLPLLPGCKRSDGPGPQVSLGGTTFHAPSGWTVADRKTTRASTSVNLAAPRGRVTCRLSRVHMAGSDDAVDTYLQQSREFFAGGTAAQVALSSGERKLRGVKIDRPRVHVDDGHANAVVQVMAATLGEDLVAVIATDLDGDAAGAEQRSRCIGAAVDLLEAGRGSGGGSTKAAAPTPMGEPSP